MEKGIVLIADCTVTYNGRAKSELERGTYLIIYKNDGSLAIHGQNKIMPLNYISNNSILTTENNTYTWKRKQEQIIIKVFNEYTKYPIELSPHTPKITNTEKDLADKIVKNWDNLVKHQGSIEREKPTPHGPIDIYSHSKDGHIIIEVKRKNATLKDITQVLRYRETFTGNSHCYIAAPKISAKALIYANKHEVKFLEVNFD